AETQSEVRGWYVSLRARCHRSFNPNSTNERGRITTNERYVFLLSGGRQAYLSLVVILPLSLVLFGLKLRWHRARSETYHPRTSD
ncbi:MAG: hypothetical protein AAF488_19090, partial [Planctomycetota bacterium]